MDSKAVGFDHGRESIDIAAKFDSWQKAGDERLWKFIISPEFGDRVDLKRLTQELMRRVAEDLGGSPLEWVAVTHYNTDHPHVHVTLRGVNSQGDAINLSREYVKSGIRNVAEDLCTQQLGYRTELDAATAERSEVNQHRYTSLDRIIARGLRSDAGDNSSGFFRFRQEPIRTGVPDTALLRQQHIRERILTLQNMGLAEYIGPNEWLVRRDFESVLRAMQRMTDRQKTLAAHGVLISDERLQVEVLDHRNLKSVEGRVLVHGEEEVGREAGRSYLMLEGTDSRVHHIYYTPEMEEARSRGRLRTNSFVRLHKVFEGGQPTIEVEDFGDSEAILRNKSHLKQTVQALMKRGVVPVEDGWGGWLGRYQAAIRRVALEQTHLGEQHRVVRNPERDRSHGR